MKFPLPAAAAATGAAQAQVGTPAIRRGVHIRTDLAFLFPPPLSPTPRPALVIAWRPQFQRGGCA